MLDVAGLDIRCVLDGGKGHCAVVRRAFEHRVRQGSERYLLVEQGLVLLKQRFLVHVRDEDRVGRRVAVVEGVQEVN